jgi:hypothetical protein
MARLLNPVFGPMKGVIGNYYTRKTKKGTEIVARAKKLHKSIDQYSVERRKKFAVTACFAKKIRSLATLDEIWNANRGSCPSSFHAICKVNYQLSSAERPTENNIITPGGFNAGFTYAEVFTDRINAKIPELTMLTDPVPEGALLSFNTLICFYEAAGINRDLYELLAFSKEYPDFDFSKNFDLEIDFSEAEKESAEKFGKAVLYISLAVNDKSGKVIQYSSTYSQTCG